MAKQNLPPPINPLSDIYGELIRFPITFRDKVEEECDWSTPTFYRKVRSFHQTVSNAELDKVIQIALDCIEELEGFIERYTKR